MGGGTVVRLLIASQFVVFLAALGLLIGVGAHTARAGCYATSALRSVAAQLRSPQCAAVVGFSVVPAK